MDAYSATVYETLTQPAELRALMSADGPSEFLDGTGLLDRLRTDQDVRLAGAVRSRSAATAAEDAAEAAAAGALALDLCGGAQSFGSSQYAWLRANAPSFGWVNPEWAWPGRGREEPWHWEFGTLVSGLGGEVHLLGHDGPGRAARRRLEVPVQVRVRDDLVGRGRAPLRQVLRRVRVAHQDRVITPGERAV